MSVIGGLNLLDEAMALTGGDEIMYLKFVSRTANEAGNYVSTFQEPVKIEDCSVQAISRNTYNQLGLDFQRNYYNVFISENVIDLQRGQAGDRFIWNGRLLQCESETDWFPINGWAEVLVVEVGKA